ncbi:hypothetical protein [Puniceibacterium sediminis]|uniref:Threonine kinase n=1 Tax=Puniceibacterium sediminis TaxID=1608407 RepID=A0A238WBU2_9RHOB|nr:hypothetical protein [Puniceibacterium sediminis]SNR43703.1 threonine kinase [Puniceibacterium sediminis]
MQPTVAQSFAKRPLHRVAGHFGEWLQGRLGPQGPVVLVTMACDAVYAEATFEPAQTLQLHQPTPTVVTQEQLHHLLRRAGRPEHGLFLLSGTAPPGAGAGASTAALVALARAAGTAEDLIADACLAAEGASDPLMLPAPDCVLWASRRAQVLRHFPAPPRCEIIGGYLGSPYRTDPEDHNFADISDLIPRWQNATETGDLPALAALASESADRTTQHRGPFRDPTAGIAHQLGALGHARAHTGSARALIFAPGTVPRGAHTVLERSGLRNPIQFMTGQDR